MQGVGNPGAINLSTTPVRETYRQIVVPPKGAGLTRLGTYMTPALGRALSGLGNVSDLPPIIYKIDYSQGGDKGDWPDTSTKAREDVKRALLAVMTPAMADTILSEQGSDAIKDLLFDKARSTADYDAGLFEDGTEKLDDVSKKYRDVMWPMYEEAAIQWLEQEGRSPGGNGPQEAGFGSTLTYVLLGLGGLAGIGYAVTQLAD